MNYVTEDISRLGRKKRHLAECYTGEDCRFGDQEPEREKMTTQRTRSTKP